MDATSISIMSFTLIKIALWFAVIGFAIALARKVIRESDPESIDEGDESPKTSDVLWSNKLRIGMWFILFFAASFYSQSEMAYRPKTVVQPSNPMLKEQLRKLDRTVTPTILPAKGNKRDAVNTGYSERNRAQNENARKSFLKLPSNQGQ